MGFSLLELLIYITVLSGIGLFIGGTFISINQSRLRAEARAEVDAAVRFVTDKIRQDLREATNITTPKSTVVSSGTLSIVLQNETITYSLNPTIDEDGIEFNQVLRNSEVLTPDTVNVTTLDFERFQNVNLPLLKVMVTVRTTMTASYNSTEQDMQFTETKYSTAPLGQIFDYVTAGNGAVEGMQFPGAPSY